MKTLKQIWDERGDKTEVRVRKRSWNSGFVRLIYFCKETNTAICLPADFTGGHDEIEIYETNLTNLNSWETFDDIKRNVED